MTLFDASLQFPTVLFTIGLLIALVYWLFVILGALDVDLLGGADDVTGALKGGGEALTGGVKGAAEIAGGHADAGDALTGAAKGSGEAVTSGAGLWAWLGLTSVPVTVSASLIMLLGWSGSVLLMHYGTGAVGPVLGAVLALAVVLAVLPVVGLLVRPLKPVFEVKVGKRNREYVGSTCTITTGHVDDGFGQAVLEEGATVLVIPVRCDRGGVLPRGARALIIDFDAARHAYLVEPVTELLGAPPAGDAGDAS
ncbi:MAG: hypothetical protein R3B06_25050 [Kofleriaceae bacterium]